MRRARLGLPVFGDLCVGGNERVLGCILLPYV